MTDQDAEDCDGRPARAGRGAPALRRGEHHGGALSSGATLAGSALLLVAIAGCEGTGPRPCRGRTIFQDADVGVCVEVMDDGGWFQFERYRAVALERRSERVLFWSDHGGDFEARRLPDGSLVVANSWRIAARVDARTWLEFDVDGDTRADPRLRDALRWMVANPRFFVDGRIRAAVDLVELGDPQGAEWVARFEATPDLGWQQRDVLRNWRASRSWR